MSAASKPSSPPASPKIRIGWFSYSCCEDSTIVLTEMMNDHWQEWKEMFDFRHARVLQANNVFDEMDVAFIEGAIASEKQAEEVRKIRGLAKRVVAIGSCACTGMPSAQRNNFNPQQKQEIEFLIEKFKASPKAQKLSEVIKIDAEVPGCPMDPKKFLDAVTKLVAELRGAK
jgi:coenzyme F420-reducing hydrogenase gamma subunit